jgi:hypothetical protein
MKMDLSKWYHENKEEMKINWSGIFVGIANIIGVVLIIGSLYMAGVSSSEKEMYNKPIKHREEAEIIERYKINKDIDPVWINIKNEMESTPKGVVRVVGKSISQTGFDSIMKSSKVRPTITETIR